MWYIYMPNKEISIYEEAARTNSCKLIVEQTFKLRYISVTSALSWYFVSISHLKQLEQQGLQYTNMTS